MLFCFSNFFEWNRKFDEIEKYNKRKGGGGDQYGPNAPESGPRSKSQTFEAWKDSYSHNTKVIIR